MRTINLGLSGLQVPVIAVGCMRINKVEKAEAERFIANQHHQGLQWRMTAL